MSQSRSRVVAIYSASTKPIARSAGRSAVAAAAYRAGVELTDDRTGLVHDYTRRSGVESAEVILPGDATADRAALWNAAEAAERRKDSRTGREWLIALPAELDGPQRAALARSFAVELVERYGVAVDVAIHLPDREGDNRNHHAHILTTTRTVSIDVETGRPVLGKKSAIELGDRDRAKAGIAGRSADDITELRARWAALANAALERAGSVERIDHRSLAAQGIDRAPTQHLGPVASDMERNGRASDRGDANRQTSAENAERVELVAQVIDLTAERDRRAAAQRAAVERAERERIERMDSKEVAAEIERLRLPSVPQVVQGRPEVQAAAGQLVSLTARRQKAMTTAQECAGQLADWQAAHPIRAKLHAWGWRHKQVEAVTVARDSNAAEARTLAPQIQTATATAAEIHASTTKAVQVEQAPMRARLAELEKIRLAKVAIERAAAGRLAAREQNVNAFRAYARKREGKFHGYGDTGKAWAALPEQLRKIIDKHNAADQFGRAKALDFLRTDDGQKLLAAVMPKEREQSRDRSGPSLSR